MTVSPTLMSSGIRLLALVVEATRTHSQDLALLGLLLGGVRNDQSRRGGLLGVQRLDQDAVLERLDLRHDLTSLEVIRRYGCVLRADPCPVVAVRDDLRRCWHSLYSSARANMYHFLALGAHECQPARHLRRASAASPTGTTAGVRGWPAAGRQWGRAIRDPRRRRARTRHAAHARRSRPRGVADALRPGLRDRPITAVRSDPLWVNQPEVVAAAATQARLRTRAAARFPGPPRWWTPDGLEQATRPVVAARHADGSSRRAYAGR